MLGNANTTGNFNPNCTINGTGSGLSGTGTQLTLTVSITFQPGFSGTWNNYLLAQDNAGLTSEWQQVGTWTTLLPTFNITVSPTSQTVAIGQSATYSVQISPTSFPGAINFQVSGLPPTGVSALFSTVNGLTTMRVTTAPSASAGTLSLRVTGTSSAGVMNSAGTASLVVNPPTIVTVSPASATVGIGGILEFQATVTGISNTAVTWSMNPPSGQTWGALSYRGGNSIGYLAPYSIPYNPYVTLTATAADGTAASAQIGIAGAGINPASNSFTSAGGAGQFSVSTAGNWQATVPVGGWITLNGGSMESGFNSGTVTYSVAANTSGKPRSGTIHVTAGSQDFTITQAGSTYVGTTPASATYTSAGGTGQLTFSPSGGISPSSDSAWITVTSVNNGVATYAVASNTGRNSRTGNLMIGQTRFPITETGTEQGPSFWMSAAPNYNGRVSQFTFDYSGDADIQTLYVLVNGELTPRHACSFKATFTNGAYQFYLENDSGDGTYMGPVSLSGPNNYNLENSQCRLTEISAAPPSGSFAEFVFGVYFKNEAFFGHKTIWTMSQDVNGYSSGWTPVGGLQFCVSWILDLDGVCWGNQKPSAITVSPTSATVYTTEAPLLTVKVTDPDGWQDVTLLDIAADDEGTDDCHFSFNPISQTFYWNGSSQVALDLAVNPQGTADNGHCRIGGSGTSSAGDASSGALVLRLPIQFDQGGMKLITVKAYDATHTSPFPYAACPHGDDQCTTGDVIEATPTTWMVTSCSNPPSCSDAAPAVYDSGPGTPQYYVPAMLDSSRDDASRVTSGSDGNLRVTVTNPSGAHELSAVTIYIQSNPPSPGAPPANSCVITVDVFNGQVYLLDDTGVTDAPVIQDLATNHQCRVTQTSLPPLITYESATELTVRVPVSFQDTYAGTRNVYVQAINFSGVMNTTNSSLLMFQVNTTNTRKLCEDTANQPGCTIGYHSGVVYTYWTRDIGPAYNPQGLPVGSNTFTNWSDFLPLKWYGAGNTAAPGVLPSDAALGASYKALIDGQLAQMR